MANIKKEKHKRKSNPIVIFLSDEEKSLIDIFLSSHLEGNRSELVRRSVLEYIKNFDSSLYKDL